MGQDACEALRLILEEFPNVLIALALVTGRARERQVAHAVGAIAAAWMDVVEFKGHVAGVTVGTLVIPLEQQSGSRVGIAAPQPPQNGS